MVRATSDNTVQRFPDAVYVQLRSLATAMLSQESPGHTLQPTALVHEAYLRLAKQHKSKDASDEQMLALGAMMIRRILVDHYRCKSAQKRGGRSHPADLARIPVNDPISVLEIDEALTKLESIDPCKAQIVMLKFFGGLSVDQIAKVTGDSPRQIAREWAFARAWLGQELSL